MLQRPWGDVYSGRLWRPNPCGSGYTDHKNDLRRVKRRGKIFLVGTGSRPPSAESYRESLNAQRKLALLKLHEGLAALCERERSPSLQAEYAASYRKVIGVSPEQRHEFRDAMERVRGGGGMSVQDVVDLMRRRYQANGLT